MDRFFPDEPGAFSIATGAGGGGVATTAVVDSFGRNTLEAREALLDGRSTWWGVLGATLVAREGFETGASRDRRATSAGGTVVARLEVTVEDAVARLRAAVEDTVARLRVAVDDVTARLRVAVDDVAPCEAGIVLSLDWRLWTFFVSVSTLTASFFFSLRMSMSLSS